MVEINDSMNANKIDRPGKSKGDLTGTTLVEIMVASALMAMVFSIGWAISNSFIGVRKVRDYEVAVALANQGIEAVRAARHREIGESKGKSKDSLLDDFANIGQPYDGEKGEGFIPIIKVGPVEFRREITVTDCPSLIDGFPSAVKVIRVLIKWKAQEDGAPVVFEAATTHADQW